MEEGLLLKEGGVVKAERPTWGVIAEEMKKLCYLAGPMVAMTLSQLVLPVISVMMVGHLGELSLSSTAMANSLCSVTGFSLLATIMKPAAMISTEDRILNPWAHFVKNFVFLLLIGDGTTKIQPVYVVNIASAIVAALKDDGSSKETLGRQNLGSMGLEAAKVQLSKLVSKVSTHCLNSAFSDVKELSDLCPQQIQTPQPTDCSMDSCLTSCEGPPRDQDMPNNQVVIRPSNFRIVMESQNISNETSLQQPERRWCEDLKDKRRFLSAVNFEAEKACSMEKNYSNLSISIRLQGGRWNTNNTYSENRVRESDRDTKFFDQPSHRHDAVAGTILH